MKIGIHLSVFTENWNDDVLPYISLSREIGYDCVEIPLMDPFNMDIKALQEELTKNNMDVTCGTGLNPTTDITSLDETTRANGINHIKKCIDICAELGSKTLNGVVHSPWGTTVPRANFTKQREQGVKSLIEIANYCEEKNITLCLEVLNRFESSYLNTMDEGVELINEVGSDFIKLHVDTFHANIEERDMYTSIKRHINKIGHVHFADNHRGTPGTGQIKFEKIVSSLKEGNYQNCIVVECFVIPNCEAGNGTFTWRKIEPTPEQMAKESFAYIDKLLKEN